MLCAPLSFDAAMNQDMPLDEEGGLNTPRNETTADRDWDDEAIDNRGSMMMNDAWWNHFGLLALSIIDLSSLAFNS